MPDDAPPRAPSETPPPAPAPPLDWNYPHAKPPEAIDNQVFFGTPRPSTGDSQSDIFDVPKDPLRFATLSFGVGLLSVFFSGADFYHQLVFVAPIFEEALKFGAGLFIVTALRIRSPPFRVVLALFPGAAFGIFEHYLTYSTEEPLIYFFRIAFHSGTAALAMAMWCALEPLPTWRHRWLSTLPGTLIHALNNVYALLVAIITVIDAVITGTSFADVRPSGEAIIVPLLLAAIAHACAWAVVYKQGHLRVVVVSTFRWKFFT
ncbi:MAG: hypothetical protein HY556_05705 [Euryarchaeota archaeon]|nr:hypothetical protein [Euryarchaeota archaeon]